MTKVQWLSIAAVVAGVWMTWPGNNSVDFATCEPDGIFSLISSDVYGEYFWNAQAVKIQDDIAATRDVIDSWKHLGSIADNSQSQKQALRTDRFQKFISDETQQRATRLRDEANKMEVDEGIRSITDTYRRGLEADEHCEAIIRELHGFR